NVIAQRVGNWRPLIGPGNDVGQLLTWRVPYQMSLDANRREACHFPLMSVAQTPDGRDVDVTFYFDTDFAQSDTTLTGVCHVPDSKACAQSSENGLGWVGGSVLTKQVRRLIDYYRCEIAYKCEVAKLPFSNRFCLQGHFPRCWLCLTFRRQLVQAKTI